MASCNKFKDINVSPTQLTSASTKGLLTNSQQALSDLILGNTAASRLPALYIQHLAEGPYPASSLYSDRNLSFSGWYTGPLNDLQTIIRYNQEGNPAAIGNGSNDNQIAVARIMKAYYFLNLTDRYGDIPYSQALKSNEAYSPVYDKQQDIYTDLFKELTEAQAQINAAKAKPIKLADTAYYQALPKSTAWDYPVEEIRKNLEDKYTTRVAQGRLKVYTTINVEAQKTLTNLVNSLFTLALTLGVTVGDRVTMAVPP